MPAAITARPEPLPSSRAEFYRRALQYKWWDRERKGQERDEAVEIAAEAALRAFVGQSKLERIQFSSSELSLALPSKVHRQCLLEAGILRKIWSHGDEAVEFVHLTFQEYFLARHWAAREVSSPPGTTPFGRALAERWTDPRYDETLALTIDQIVSATRAVEVNVRSGRTFGGGRRFMMHGRRSSLRWAAARSVSCFRWSTAPG